MILSMTGYGKAVVTYKEKKINVEVKSLNSKALDLSTRIAPIYREKEMEIRQVIAKALIRGKVDFSIWVEKDATVDAAPINGAIVENYYKQLKAISASAGIPEPSDWFATLLSLPDVTTRTQIEELSDEEWQVAQQAIHQALDALLAFRRQEGAALEKKFHEKVDNIEALLHSFAEKADTLTGTERSILQYYIDGYAIKDIPELSYISANTVKTHNRNIYRKLGINSFDELKVYIDLFERCGRSGELLHKGE